jgi:hypothetical protein
MPPRKHGAVRRHGAPAAQPAAQPQLPMPQTPEQLQTVLAAMLAPDTQAIKHATAILTQFLKTPPALPALRQQIQLSAVPESRQMAAVLLRKGITKLWKGQSPAEKEETVRPLLLADAQRAAARAGRRNSVSRAYCAE